MTHALRSFARLALMLLAVVIAPVANAQSSASDYTYATRFDAANRVVGIIAPDPDGAGAIKFAATRTTYDSAGHAVLVEKGQLSSWQSEAVLPSDWPAWNGTTGFQVFSKVATTFDALDRKTAESVSGSSDGGATWTQSSLTQYGYDIVGRLECTAVRMDPARWSIATAACDLQSIVSSPHGPDRITKNVYDDAGQLLKVIKGYGQTTANGLEQLQQDYVTYTYTDNGKQATVRDANGNLASYTYDGFDRLARWSFPSKTTPGSVSATDYEAYTYDANDNKLSLRKRDGNTINYSLDALNRVIFKDIPGGTSSDVYFGYDARGLQLYARFASPTGIGITNSFDGFGRLTTTTNDMGATSRTLTYEYDAEGNRTKLTYPDSTYFTYVYDGLERLTTINEAGATMIVSSAFDPQGNLVSKTRGGVTSTFGYDAVSRPTSWADDLAGTASDVTTTFTYSPADQILTKARSNTAYAWSGYTTLSRSYTTNGLNQYTAAGSAIFGYDDNGSLTGDGTNSYTYDVENRMVTATVGGFTNTLKYDPLGRLWQVVTPSKTLEFTHDGDSVVMERNGANPFRYVHGPGDDDPMFEYAGTGYSLRTSLHPDYQGSIVARADASGNKTAINAYDDYGITLGSNVGRFQYTGQMWLSQIGLYYYKARMYSPTLGRFMQTDPIGYDDQLNLYAYVASDPINSRDPTGTNTICTWTRHIYTTTYSDGRKPTVRVVDGPKTCHETTGRQPNGSYIAATGPGSAIWEITSSPSRQAKKMIGNGQCVAACKFFSGVPGPTERWRAGAKVLGNRSLPIGTAIATFAGKNGAYKCDCGQNSGIYMGQGANGKILIFDQWPSHGRGDPDHPAQIRELGFSRETQNNADAYRVIIVE